MHSLYLIFSDLPVYVVYDLSKSMLVTQEDFSNKSQLLSHSFMYIGA
jgi:hypothetical protein